MPRIVEVQDIKFSIRIIDCVTLIVFIHRLLVPSQSPCPPLITNHSASALPRPQADVEERLRETILQILRSRKPGATC